MNKALFLDRDGIINKNFGHVHKIENIKFLNGIFDLAKFFYNTGFIIIVVTNQAGIGKGLYTIDQFNSVTQFIHNSFEQHGVIINETFFCPHTLSDNCECRKPKIGLIKLAALKYNIDLNNSFMIGDKNTDYQACLTANIKYCYLKNKNEALSKLLNRIIRHSEIMAN